MQNVKFVVHISLYLNSNTQSLVCDAYVDSTARRHSALTKYEI